MAKKRPTIKGKGADIFLGNDPEDSTTGKDSIPARQHTSTPSNQPTQKPVQGKATFYLPSPLLEKLDEVWLTLRRKNRKLKKSDIVRNALEKELATHK